MAGPVDTTSRCSLRCRTSGSSCENGRSFKPEMKVTSACVVQVGSPAAMEVPRLAGHEVRRVTQSREVMVEHGMLVASLAECVGRNEVMMQLRSALPESQEALLEGLKHGIPSVRRWSALGPRPRSARRPHRGSPPRGHARPEQEGSPSRFPCAFMCRL